MRVRWKSLGFDLLDHGWLGQSLRKVWFPIAVFAAVRLWLWLLGILSMSLTPAVSVPESFWQGVEPVTLGLRGLLVGPWMRWDALWYIRIASSGYAFRESAAAFFPLYPALSSVVARLGGGDYAGASFVVSNGACVLALIAIYRLTRLELGERAARRTVLYQAVFPTAFFMFAPYSESLFLLWVVASMYAARAGYWRISGGLGLLAALTRSIGVLLIVPLAWELWEQQRRSGQRGFDVKWLSLGLVPLGLLAYCAYLAAYEGDPLLWLNSQSDALWDRALAWPWDTMREIVVYSFRSANGVIELCSLVGFAALTVLALRRLPLAYGLYMALSLGLPLLSPSSGDPLYSMPRFVLVLYPAFMLLGQAGEQPRWNRVILYSFFPAMSFLAVLFVQWYWVA